jgi:poly-gamma-glutamate capsule biosynthesis protein CapA/YwtB (metallophosphatase superfamily)
MYASTYDWGNIDHHQFENGQLPDMKKTCQRHCFSTLNHNLAYCYDDSRVIKFVWTQLVKNRLKGGARSFDE